MRGGPDELHFLPDSSAFARRVARALGVPARPVALHRFPDRESLVRVAAPAARCAILTAQLHDPDSKLVPVLLAADALRRSGVMKLVLLVPYLPYMRQDVVFEAGEALAQRVFAETLGRSVDEIVTLEPHLHRIQHLDEVFPCRTRSLPAAPLLADWCRKRGGRPLLVGPDAESEPWVRGVARRAGLPWLVGRKCRLSDRRVRIELPEHAPAQRAILIDDIASSGATLAAAARALRRDGVDRIEAAVVHAVFAAGAQRRIRDAGVVRIVSCDTIPHVTNSIGTAAYFAQAMGTGKRDRRA
jgi:ribose-phosphate pyrophosphokinase